MTLTRIFHRLSIPAEQSGLSRFWPAFRRLVWALAVWLQLLEPVPAQAADLMARSWPEADALFHQDSRWLGGDGATSIALGGDRVLWLFGDSFIAGPGQGRREAAFIRNSLAIQTGLDPSRARVVFHWGRPRGRPESFFPDEPGRWSWPGGGVRLDGHLLIFLMKIKTAPGPLGFAADGWSAVRIDHPDHDPDTWSIRQIEAPANPWGVILGSGPVLGRGGHLHVFGGGEPPGRVCLARWPLAAVRGDKWPAPRWWAEPAAGRSGGPSNGWTTAPDPARGPSPLFTDGQNEFSVHWESRLGAFLTVQTKGFGPAELAWRQAPTLGGTWSPLVPFFRPPEADRPDVLIYAGKAHPELRGADLVLTYVVNSLNEQAVLGDLTLYFPRFLKGRWE